jgi:beta-glucosidase
VGFKRVNLDPGQGERVALHVSSGELSYWSTQAQNWVLGVGQRNVYVGASSRDIRLQGSAQVEQENDHGH